MKTIKTEYKQINLFQSIEKSFNKQSMNIKTEYVLSKCDEIDGDYIYPIITSVFFDDDLDPIKIRMDLDRLEINTKEFKHINLTEDHLLFLLKFIRHAKKEEIKCDNMKITKEQLEYNKEYYKDYDF